MRKYLLIMCVFLTSFFTSLSAQSSMPDYPDDKEFKLCTSTIGDWNQCAAEEAQRHLSTVRRQYREVLGNPEVLNWHAKPEENTQILRDMYESWTAFRNRLCSLANKASIHLAPLLEEKTSCNLYYVLHHQDHLDSIILLMQKKAPQNVSEFTFLQIPEHDELYTKCVESKQKDCLNAELKRSTQQIKDLYKTFSEDEFVGRWNNGPDLKQGNYRDMYDSWIAYRNRMCSLAVWAYQSYYGPKSINQAQCLQFYNREKLETMQNLLVVAHSSLDVEFESDLTPPEQQHEDYEKDDGGTAEGQTITPLERHIDAGTSGSDDALIKEENPKQPQPEPQKNEDKRNIPAWAN